MGLYLPAAIVGADFIALVRHGFIPVMYASRVAHPRYKQAVAFVKSGDGIMGPIMRFRRLLV